MDNFSQEAIEVFWQRCGHDGTFPRDIERVTALALPVTVIKLPNLSLRAIENWLRQRGIPFHFGCRSRTIRGCLVAFGGRGLIFIDGNDSEDEQRFTIAHESAHFLVDYWLPRQRALQKFGPSITDVMDGHRRPTVVERLNALIINIRVGIYTDLMGREPEDAPNKEVLEIENRADSVALEILAPQEDVLSLVGFAGEQKFSHKLEKVNELLTQHFGLPASVSKSYSHSILLKTGQGPSWMESLGFG